jgi:rhodanese-related sulfurtransferase
VEPDHVPAVTVGELPRDIPPDSALFLLDVREPHEWEAGHIAGAVHIPMGELVERLAEVPHDRDVIAVCRSGNRSAAVTAYLTQAGWAVRNLDGGMLAWQEQGRPMVRDGAKPPSVL